MNKNNFFEKVGKLTFSILLTGIIVSTAVYGATTWKTLSDGDVINGSDWSDMVAAIDAKISNVDLSNYYTKSEANDNFTSSSDALNNVIDKCEICLGWADSGRTTPTKTTCSGFNDGFKFLNTDGDVDGNDNFFVKVVCETGTWSASVSQGTESGCRMDIFGTSKSGSCSIGETYTYYTGGTSSGCPTGGGGDPMYRGMTKFTQTCN